MRQIGSQGRMLVARQDSLRGNIVQRSFAFPEVRAPAFTSGFATMHSDYGPYQGTQKGLTGVRQWPTSGPNPAMPGTLIRVRQETPGPGHRDTAV